MHNGYHQSREILTSAYVIEVTVPRVNDKSTDSDGCARRDICAPVLTVGDGARGLWNALGEVFPQAREGRCWLHKTANVLAALPKSADPGEKAMAKI